MARSLSLTLILGVSGLSLALFDRAQARAAGKGAATCSGAVALGGVGQAIPPASATAAGFATIGEAVGGPSLGAALAGELATSLAASGNGAADISSASSLVATPEVASVQLVDDSALGLMFGNGEARPVLVGGDNLLKDGGKERRRSGKVVILAQYN